MKMRKVLMVALVALSMTFPLMADERMVTEVFSVEVDALADGGKTDKSRLKEKAVLMAKDKFPFLVEGTESMVNGDYQQMIKSATIVYAKAVILDSQLKAGNTRFSGEVEVSLDITKSVKLLSDLKEQKKLEARVNEAVEKIVALTKDDMSPKDIKSVSAIRSKIEVELLMAGSFDSAVSLAQSRVDNWIAKRDALVARYANESRWSVTRVDPIKKQMMVEVVYPDFRAEYDALISEYKNDEDYPSDLPGKVCGVSRLGLHFGQPVFYLKKGRSFHRSHPKSSKFSVKLDKNDLPVFNDTFEIMPCIY